MVAVRMGGKVGTDGETPNSFMVQAGWTWEPDLSLQVERNLENQQELLGTEDKTRSEDH
mgnify:CR=1 FL=1